MGNKRSPLAPLTTRRAEQKERIRKSAVNEVEKLEPYSQIQDFFIFYF